MKLSGDYAANEQPVPDVMGMDKPYYVREIAYEYPGYTRITFWPSCSEVVELTAGDCGVQVRTLDASEVLDGIGPAEGFANEWRVVAVHCAQTGGMCMVDVLTFENGAVLTVNDEVAILWRSHDDWLDASGEDGEHLGCLVWYESENTVLDR